LLRWGSTDHEIVGVKVRAEPERRLRAVKSSTLAVEIPEHGEDAPVVVSRREEIELGEDVGDVLFDRAVTYYKRGSDSRIGAPFSHERENIKFARSERFGKCGSMFARAYDLADDIGIEGSASARHSGQGIHEFCDVGDTVFQKVTNPRRVLSK